MYIYIHTYIYIYIYVDDTKGSLDPGWTNTCIFDYAPALRRHAFEIGSSVWLKVQGTGGVLAVLWY